MASSHSFYSRGDKNYLNVAAALKMQKELGGIWEALIRPLVVLPL